ncbi:hypothetical protein [Paractinoplanes brasiliensis]|uniref:Uncharacterized protein n=1 Tax=Paractinoplanes brasiliensis TaxID=52695 RepID=A0A4R6K1Y1_9ACTN|nr:hypothetical protein [Actinoplanes brasiliensis]TDO41135.1 hypothetical protein C8E87_4864 [Actinoplanes brasiliensis]GID26205.1 hypothetical protein Abr02nite_11880 [Actinoplanes brasiliensis]
MNNVLEQTETGREIARRNRADVMRALLKARYGEFDDLQDLAERLVDRDYDDIMARIVAGATLAELRS